MSISLNLTRHRTKQDKISERGDALHEAYLLHLFGRKINSDNFERSLTDYEDALYSDCPANDKKRIDAINVTKKNNCRGKIPSNNQCR